MQGFVADLLRHEGALVEAIDPDGLEVLAPPPVQDALGLGELARLGFGGTLPPGAQRVGMEAEIDRLTYGALVGVVDVVDVVAVEGQEGLFEWRLAHPRRFAMPIPYSGAAGIFRVPMKEIKMYLRPFLV